jgi:hypothetical protein
MAQVVLVGVEGAVEPGFQQFFGRLEHAQKLARIVINARNTELQRSHAESDVNSQMCKC